MAVAQTTPDGVLVQQAAAGSGDSYGLLYDRYAEQVFNYCLRLTGSADDAADATQEAFAGVLRRLRDDDRPVLEFSAYLFAAARNESYALMRRRARVRPSDAPPEERGRVADVDTEPERAALLHDSQEAVRAANARLTPRHREVLALRELNDRSYEDIGRIMGITENGAAQLIWRARSKLREAMTAGAVASVVATSEDCERAQVLLTRIQDGEPLLEPERIWLDDHLEHCGACRAARGMLLEVGASYRCWLPVAVLAGLKADTLTAAGAVVGADWSGAAAGAHAGGSGAGAGGGGSGGAGAGGSGATTGGVGASSGGVGGLGAGGAATAAAGVATLAAVTAVGVGLAAILGGGETAEKKAGPGPAATEPAKPKGDVAGRMQVASSNGAAATVVAQRVAGALREPATSPEPAASSPSGPPEDSPQLKTLDTGPGPQGDALRPNSPSPPGQSTEPPADMTPPAGPSLPNDTPPDEKPNPPPDDPPPEERSPPENEKPPDTGPPPGEPDSCTWPGRGEGPSDCPPGHDENRDDDEHKRRGGDG